MSEELVRVGGPLAAAGLAVLVLAGPRGARLAGLAAWAVGTILLVPLLAPSGHTGTLAAAGGVGLALAAVLAVVVRRWPWALPFAALAAAPARIPVSIGSTDASLLVPLYVVVAGGALALVWELAAERPSRSRELGPLAVPLAALVAWLGVSVAWTNDLREGAIQLLFFVLPFAILSVSLARLPWRRRPAAGLYGLLAVMALAFAAVGVVQWVTRDVFWNPKVIVGNAVAPFYRVNSVFWDPSIYGRFLVVAILATLALLLARTRPRLELGLVVVVAGAWVGLLFSFSQSSFAALVAGVAVAAALAWRWRAVLAIGLVAAVMVPIGAVSPQFENARDSLFGSSPTGLDDATSGRSRLVSNGIGIALDHPLVGVGLGGFKQAYTDDAGLGRRAPPKAASHTTPVTVAAETGFPGLFLLVALVAVALRAAFARTRGGTLARPVGWTAGLTVAAVFVHSLFYNAFFEDPLVWGAFGLAALAAANRDREPAA